MTFKDDLRHGLERLQVCTGAQLALFRWECASDLVQGYGRALATWQNQAMNRRPFQLSPGRRELSPTLQFFGDNSNPNICKKMTTGTGRQSAAGSAL